MYTLVKPMAVTPDDNNPNNAVLPDGTNPEFIYVGVSGDVEFVLADKSIDIRPHVASGAYLWVPFFTGVRAGSTTATGISATRRK